MLHIVRIFPFSKRIVGAGVKLSLLMIPSKKKKLKIKKHVMHPPSKSNRNNRIIQFMSYTWEDQLSMETHDEFKKESHVLW